MEINIVAVVSATLVMFAIGAVWYMVFFANKWGEMHGLGSLSEKEQKEMAASMGPFYGLQLLMTVISAVVLAYMMALLPDIAPMLIAFLVWAGFVLPTDVSSVIFGGTKGKDIAPKILIQAGEALVRLVAAALVISLF
ncbi:MAG: DUF1761 domain-containing protein [Candidatus Saccharimonadales bacterium]